MRFAISMMLSLIFAGLKLMAVITWSWWFLPLIWIVVYFVGTIVKHAGGIEGPGGFGDGFGFGDD